MVLDCAYEPMMAKGYFMAEGQSAKILIVDDEPANIVLLSRLLNHSYEVVSAQDGKSALDLLATDSYDLVLLDIMMPRMSGFDVLQAIRGGEATSDTPVILISALTENEYIVRGLGLGANDYITKPIEPQIVIARVQTQVRLK